MARVIGTSTRDTERIMEERRALLARREQPRPDARLSDEGRRRLENEGRVGQQDRTGSQTGRSSEPSNRAEPEPVDFNLDDFFGSGPPVPSGAPQRAGLFGGGNLPLLIGAAGLLAGGVYFLMNR